MLRWALIFLLVALVASALGMWGLGGLAMEIALGFSSSSSSFS